MERQSQTCLTFSIELQMDALNASDPEEASNH